MARKRMIQVQVLVAFLVCLAARAWVGDLELTIHHILGAVPAISKEHIGEAVTMDGKLQVCYAVSAELSDYPYQIEGAMEVNYATPVFDWQQNWHKKAYWGACRKNRETKTDRPGITYNVLCYYLPIDYLLSESDDGEMIAFAEPCHLNYAIKAYARQAEKTVTCENYHKLGNGALKSIAEKEGDDYTLVDGEFNGRSHSLVTKRARPINYANLESLAANVCKVKVNGNERLAIYLDKFRIEELVIPDIHKPKPKDSHVIINPTPVKPEL